MKREIKFRAWNIEKGRWSNDDDSYWGDGDNFTPVENVNINLDSENFTFEQYTGLEDKNGKEIYEGDIVKLDYEETKIRNEPDVCEGVFTEYQEKHEGIFEITFNKNWAAFVLIIHDTNIVEESLGDAKYSVEVIGNIHENPELLEEEK